jgi:hypothetical protein
MSSREKVAREEVAKLHRRLEQVVRDCADGLIRKSELQQFFHESREKLAAVLDLDTRPYRVFDANRHEIGSFWVNDNRPPYADGRDCEHAKKWLDLVASVLREVDPAAAAIVVNDQYALPAGDAYGSVRTIYRVMKSAATRLAIVDPHLDSTVFDYLDEIANEVELQLLTGGRPKPMFVHLLAELRKLRGPIHAKAFDQFHDRFLIVDGTDVWQLGCSLNGVGKATSMFGRVID